MRVMVIVKASKESEAGVLPDARILSDKMKFNEDLVKAGILLSADGLHPTSEGKRVKFNGRERTVVDGPFSATKELIAGYWVWQVSSMEEAVEWVKRCPNPTPGESEIEIRRLFETSEMPEATPEILAKEKALRETVAARSRD